MMYKFLTVVLSFSVTTTFAQVQKNDTLSQADLEPVTIIGSKSKNITGSGTYISNQKIQQLNQTNVNNVLKTIPGVNIRDEEGFGLRPNIGLRGTPVNRSAKITLMEDGVLVAPAPYADPAAYYFPTFIRIQGVEVLKGSSQIKYGPYTIGGAVNLISTPIPNTFKAFAQVAYGSYNTNMQRLWVGDSQKNLDYVFEVARLASTGFKELDNGGNTGFDRRDIMGKVRWHTTENAKLRQSVTFKFINSTEDGNETYLGLTFNDYQNNPLRRYAGTQKDRLDMYHKHYSVNHFIAPLNNLTINTTVYHNTTFRDWARASSFGGQSINNILNNPTANPNAYAIMTGTSNGSIDYQSAARTFIAKGVQSYIQYIINQKNFQHKLQAGVRVHTDNADRFATRSVYNMTNGNMVLTQTGIKGNQENQFREASSTALYMNYDIKYKNLLVNIGVRHESIKFNLHNFGNNDVERLGTALLTANNHLSVLLPGIGFNYSINEYQNVFGGINKGFSPPGMPSTTSSQQAKPEKSINYELGYKLNKENFNLQVTGFINQYSNILGSDNISGGGAGTGDMFNAGNALVQGVELSFMYNLIPYKTAKSVVQIPLTLAYTYTDATFAQTFVNGGGDWGTGTINKGDAIPFITPHLLTVSVGVEYKKLNASIVARYTGLTRVKPGQTEVVLPASNVSYTNVNALAAFTIVDFSANYNLSKIFTVFTTINNLTNNTAIVANLPQGYRPNMPININGGIKVNL